MPGVAKQPHPQGPVAPVPGKHVPQDRVLGDLRGRVAGGVRDEVLQGQRRDLARPVRLEAQEWVASLCLLDVFSHFSAREDE